MANEIVKTNKEQGLAPAPSFMEKGDRRGLETITKEDMLVPRLALAQALSPEVTEGDPKHVPGMKPGDLFNSLTKQIYPQPVYVQILRKDSLRAMEFIPLSENANGGVRDPNVPMGDPRLKWGENGEKPKATLFRDFLAVILPGEGHPRREMIALSFKSSGIKVAKALNGMIATRNKPIFAGKYVITSGLELKPKPHKVYLIDNADWVSEEDYNIGAEGWEAMKDLDVTIDRGQPDVPGEGDGEEPPF